MRTLITALACFIFLPSPAQNKAADILMASAKKLRSKHSVSYTAKMKMKFFSGDDTIRHTGKVKLLRYEKDSLFNSMILLTADDTTFKLYNTSNIYVINKSKKEVTRYSPADKYKWAITGNVTKVLIWDFFQKPSMLEEMTDTAHRLSLLKDTLLDKNKCWVVQVKYPDDGEYTGIEETVCISQKDSIPVFTSYKIKFQGNYQYSNLYLLSYTFDKLDQKYFSESIHIPAGYRTEDHIEKKFQLLDLKTAAPVIAGKDYQNNLQTDTIDFPGKITILDFWYMSCAPCIKAIPQLEKLKEKYAGQIQVYGINSADNNERGIKKLPTFLQHNPIHYPIILTAETIPEKYLIEVWPTFYVIDQQGRIHYGTYGLSDDLFDRLSKAIDELL